MFFVYILFSKKLNRFYIGTTDDIERRLREHNSGLYSGSFTSKGIPWELTLSYCCQSSEIAYKLERFIKKMKSKKFIISIIESEKIIDDIVLKL